MSAPLTAAQMLQVLTAEGVAVVEIPGWQEHNRNHKGPFGSVNGLIIHHTGSDTADADTYARTTLWNGFPSLPGPLCQAGGAPDGRIYMVGNGRCNHAGGGDAAVLARVIPEDVPLDAELHPTKGNLDGIDGNRHFYGLEIMYSGAHAMSPAQHDAAVKWSAAICRAHGWSARSVIGHREWSKDKPDPGSITMGQFRRDVQARLDATAAAHTG
ncbi:MAG: N-acetylmuramoyl-L-alanine amidase [Lapillicoccus sp.]